MAYSDDFRIHSITGVLHLAYWAHQGVHAQGGKGTSREAHQVSTFSTSGQCNSGFPVSWPRVVSYMVTRRPPKLRSGKI